MITNQLLTDRERFCLEAYLMGIGTIDLAYVCSRKSRTKSQNLASIHSMSLRWRNSEPVLRYIETLGYVRVRLPNGDVDYRKPDPLNGDERPDLLIR